MEVRTYTTGSQELIEGLDNRIPEFDSRTGDHLWVMISMFKTSPESMREGLTAIMDHENLLTVQGPGCYYCEKPFTPLLATRRCKGQP